MHHPEPLEATHGHQAASIIRCPNCEKLHVMNIKTIRPAMFRGQDTIVYRCSSCGTERTQNMT